MITFHSMKIYWIAYNYGRSGMEMIDGPFGTLSEANGEHERLLAGAVDKDLVIVAEHKEVVIV